MTKRLVFIPLMLAIFLCASVNGGQVAGPGLKSRSCIAGLCIYPESLTRAQLVNEYGGKPKAQIYCYKANPTDVCITFTVYDHPSDLSEYIESISLSKQCTCKNPLSPKKAFPELLTSEGLGLDVSYERVIALYGKPNWIRAKDKEAAKGLEYISKVTQIKPGAWKSLLHEADIVFGYIPDPNELNALFIYFKNHHVIEIEASESE